MACARAGAGWKGWGRGGVGFAIISTENGEKPNLRDAQPSGNRRMSLTVVVIKPIGNREKF